MNALDTSQKEVKCYYLSLLPRQATWENMHALLQGHGKIEKLRLSKENEMRGCKGYGYVLMVPYYSLAELHTRALQLFQPIYLSQILGPKFLGGEHTKFLQRSARAEINKGKCTMAELKTYFESFGSLEALIPINSASKDDYITRMHLVYFDETGPRRLSLCSYHYLGEQTQVKVTTFLGQQEAPFDISGDDLRHLVRRTAFGRGEKVQSQWLILPPAQGPLFGCMGEESHPLNRDLYGIVRRPLSVEGINDKSFNTGNKQISKSCLPNRSISSGEECARSSAYQSELCFGLRQLRCTISSRQLGRYGIILDLRHNPLNTRLNIFPDKNKLRNEETTALCIRTYSKLDLAKLKNKI